MSEQEEFLKELEVKDDSVLDSPLVPDENQEKPEDEMKAKNRRERRLLEKNQQLREEAIAAQARLQALTEAREETKNTEPSEFEMLVERIYGTATPEAQEATEILKRALRGVKESAKAEALQAFSRINEEKESKAIQARQEEDNLENIEEDNLENIMDEIEDAYGIDMSEGSEDRKGFLTLLEKLSPKDRDGSIIEFADPASTAELYLAHKDKSSRAKDLASRSMVRGGTPQTTVAKSAQDRFLAENGII